MKYHLPTFDPIKEAHYSTCETTKAIHDIEVHKIYALSTVIVTIVSSRGYSIFFSYHFALSSLVTLFPFSLSSSFPSLVPSLTSSVVNCLPECRRHLLLVDLLCHMPKRRPCNIQFEKSL